MLLEHRKIDIELLGDPHLGKRFRTGVPLHRKGDREKMQWADFEKSLNTECDVHVCMGDIFDEFIVSLDTIAKTAGIYRAAATKYPNTFFVLIRGNHDASRDMERTSAFDILAAMLADVTNIKVVIDEVFNSAFGMAFVPWHPVKNSVEMAQQVEINTTIAFGHWDVVTVEDHYNRLPIEVLKAAGCEVVVTGHDHTKRTFELDDVEIIVTGSMQPYSHAEDQDGVLYITTTPEQVRKMAADQLKNKCIRVVLQDGEVFDDQIDCLALTTKREGVPDSEDEPDIDVEFEQFDFAGLLKKAFAEAGVTEGFVERTQKRLDDARLKSEG